MSRGGLDTLLWLLDEAFERSDHSLLRNLESIRDEHFNVAPEGATRTAAAILGHVGGSKYMYVNFGFGDQSFEYGKGDVVPPHGREALIEWLREGHRRVLAAYEALGDDLQLERVRQTPWRGEIATRDIARVLIEHDLYHAGELNHLRAILDGSDRWPTYD